MHDRTDSPTPLPGSTSFVRRAGWVALAGWVGLLSLLLQAVPTSLLTKAPELAALPPLTQRAVLMLNPLVLLIVAVLVGAALAHQVGLRSWLAGTEKSDQFVRSLGLPAVLGAALGLLLAAIDSALLPHLGAQWQRLVADAPSGGVALITGLLYGGMTEEVLLRWGLMSLAAWVLMKLMGQHRRSLAVAFAILVSAAAFSLAHLPAVAVQIELTPVLIARTLLLNALAGLLYGWLFMRHHLEAAMVAHAATHMGLAAWRLAF